MPYEHNCHDCKIHSPLQRQCCYWRFCGIPTLLIGVLQEMAKLSLSKLLLLGSVFALLGSAVVQARLSSPTSFRYTMGHASIPTVGLSRTAVITVLPGTFCAFLGPACGLSAKDNTNT